MNKQSPVTQRATTLDLPPQIGTVIDLAWEPNGQRIAAVTCLGYLCVWHTQTGKLLMRTRLTRTRLLTVAWARQGSALAAGSIDGRFYRVEDIECASPLMHCYPFAAPITKIAWSVSPVGRCLIVAGSTMTILNEPGHDPLRLRYPTLVRDAAWSRDGRTFAVLCQDGLIELWDASARKARCSLTAIDQPRCLSWHQDGRQLAVGTTTGQIQVCDLQGKEIQSTPKLSAFPLDRVRWGKAYLVAGSDQGIVLWDGISLHPLTLVKQRTRGPLPLMLDPQGEHLALPVAGTITIAPLVPLSA